jgi:hypothetical protein
LSARTKPPGARAAGAPADGARPVEVQVVHASPGRVRLRLSDAALSDPHVRGAEGLLASMPGIGQVRVNPWARSVTITYDPEAVDPAALFAAAEAAGVRVTAPSSPNGHGPSPPGDGTELGDRISSVFGRADRRVVAATGGIADLRTLVPVGLSALAAREILSGRAGAAPWYVLVWYAFEIFTKPRRPEGTADRSP